jgi:putative membrane protein
MYAWQWEPSVLIGLALLAGGYLAGVGPLRDRFAGSAPVPRWRSRLFLVGVLILFVALVSPLDTLADSYLLSMHMVQHLLITLIVPPLLLVGTPGWLLRPLLRPRYALPIGRALTNPVFAFLVFNMTFAAWHVPALYELTLENEAVHILEHLMFLVTATLTWWPIFGQLDELPRLPDPAQIVYLFLQSLPPTILGALITFAGAPLYPAYTTAPRVWGLSVMADQQIGGLIMWIPGALVFFAVLTGVFFRWLNREEYERSQDVRRVAR